MTAAQTTVPAPAPGNVTAVILAGGLGRRMSADGAGVDKGLVSFMGRPLVSHVIERLQTQVTAILLNTDPESPSWKRFGLPLLGDHIAGRPGPLAGIHAAMLASRTPWILAVPCDTPRLPSDLLARLTRTQLETGAKCVSVNCCGRSHPATALLHTSLQESVRVYLERGGRRIESWYGEIDWAQTEFEDEHAFVNLNTPDELRMLEAGS